MATNTDSTNWHSMSDQAIVSQLGAILRQFRLQQNLTQEELAMHSGLSRSAIYELENGKTATSLITVVKVLRSLHMLQVFDTWFETEADTPFQKIKISNKARVRAVRKENQRKKEEDEWDWL